MKRKELLDIIEIAKIIIVESRQLYRYDGLCGILDKAIDTWSDNMGFTSNLLAGVVFKSIQNDMIMAMFLEFYNQKFNENIINTKEYLPFGESETNTWQTRDESINSWFDKRIQFLKDWEQAIINGEFQSEYISEDELTTNGFEKNSLLL